MNTIVKVLIFIVLSVAIGIPATSGLFFVLFVGSLIKKRSKRTPQPVYYVSAPTQKYYF